MFRNSLKVGNIFGFELQIHWSLLIIFALIATHLGLGVLPMWHPAWSPPLIGLVAITASIVFFASIAIHELAHAIAARAYGLDVSSITLFLFGGVSNLEAEPRTPGSEALIAIVGPLTSFLVGAGMLGLAAATLPPLDLLARDPVAFMANLGPLATILLWAGPVNLVLAAFNMIPAFPMDGGRVLRAAIWKVIGDMERATIGAAWVGQAFAAMLVAAGVLMAFGLPVPVFGTGFVGGIWVALIGWFIGTAARGTVALQSLRRALQGVPTSEVATTAVRTVDVNTPMDVVVQGYLRGRNGDHVLVSDGDMLVGMVSIEDARRLTPDMWSHFPVRQVMHDLSDLHTVEADSDAFEAFKELRRYGERELPVTDHGHVAGMLRLNDVARWFRVYGPASSRRAA